MDDLDLPPLHQAAADGDAASVRRLLATQQAQVDDLDDHDGYDGYGYTALQWACKEGHLDVAKILVQEFGANLSFTANEETIPCPFHVAVENGHLNIVQWLVTKHSVDVESSFDGYTSFLLACLEGQLGVARWLVTHGGANERARDVGLGDTAIHIAASCGRVEIVEWLVTQRIVNVHEGNDFGETALHVAAHNRHLNVVQWLVREGKANVQIADDCLSTVLHEAVSLYRELPDNFHLIRFLITEGGADVHAANMHGQTPLHLAIRKLDYVRILVEEGNANILATGGDADTPLHEAAAKGYLDTLQWFLMRQGGQVNVAAEENQIATLVENKNTKNGSTPLHCAVRHGHLAVTQWLVTQGGANVFATDNDGNTALHLAVKGMPVVQGRPPTDHARIVQWLLQLPINEAALPLSLTRNASGELPIHLACQHRKYDAIRFLLESPDGGASVGLTNSYGNTPLHIACQKKDLQTLQLLVHEFGADANQPNTSGKTPLSIACESERLDLIYEMVRSGNSFIWTRGRGIATTSE